MNKSTVISIQDRDSIADSFTDILRIGARKLIEQAIQAEVEELLSHYAGQLTDTGHAAVVRNGYLPERAIQTGIGPVTVKTQSPFTDWRTDHLSFCIGSTLPSQNAFTGSCDPLALSQGRKQW